MHVKVSRRLVFIPAVDASLPSLRHDSIRFDTISLTGIHQSRLHRALAFRLVLVIYGEEMDVLDCMEGGEI